MKVKFYDLREKLAAQERGVEPGYFLTVTPISERDLRNERLVFKLAPLFHKELEKNRPPRRSDTRIALDTRKGVVVDPAASWRFLPAGYIDDLEMLVVRAERPDPDEAQDLLVLAQR
ncbi:hypothetical protein MUP65_02100 [Patescibacteria group bacterium]|nr:hypothetical protein [Patescibacteria group bacterium]